MKRFILAKSRRRDVAEQCSKKRRKTYTNLALPAVGAPLARLPAVNHLGTMALEAKSGVKPDETTRPTAQSVSSGTFAGRASRLVPQWEKRRHQLIATS